MNSSLANFELGLTRARAIMRVGNVADPAGQFTQSQGHFVHGDSVRTRRVNTKVVRAVDGIVTSHSDRDAETVQHFFGGGYSGPHDSGLGGPAGDVDRSSSGNRRGAFGDGSVIVHLKKRRTQQVVVGHGGDIRSGVKSFGLVPNPIPRDNIEVRQAIGGSPGAGVAITVDVGNISGHSGQSSYIFKPAGIDNKQPHKLTHSGSVDQFEYFRTKSVVEAQRIERITGQEHSEVPQRQWYFQKGVVKQCQVLGERFGHGQRLSSFVTSRQGNACFGEHGIRLAEHDPTYEVACPQCGQRFIDNGWTGFTPVYPDGYGERTWQCPGCLNDLKAIPHRPMKTGSTGDPTICEHCGHAMTDPYMVGSKWMNQCTYCGHVREVSTRSPLLQQQLQNWPPYPTELQSVDPGRAWMAVGKFAKVSGDLSYSFGRSEIDLAWNECWRASKVTQAYDHEHSLINTATLLVSQGTDIAEAAQWLENALIQAGRLPEQAQAIVDEVFMRR